MRTVKQQHLDGRLSEHCLQTVPALPSKAKTRNCRLGLRIFSAANRLQAPGALMIGASDAATLPCEDPEPMRCTMPQALGSRQPPADARNCGSRKLDHRAAACTRTMHSLPTGSTSETDSGLSAAVELCPCSTASAVLKGKCHHGCKAFWCAHIRHACLSPGPCRAGVIHTDLENCVCKAR